MVFDPSRLVVFLHVILFAYWLGADLGVMITSIYANRQGVAPEARAQLLKANILIDMAPRTCLVLMVPVGLTLSTYWDLPLATTTLAAVWVAALVWLWLVWQVHFQHGTALGSTYWRVDLAIRIAVTIGFIGFGAWCLTTGLPIGSKWLATKFVLFGLVTLCGVAVRFLLLAWSRPAAIAKWDATKPVRFFNPIRNFVFAIWALVLAMAFLGIAKPF